MIFESQTICVYEFSFINEQWSKEKQNKTKTKIVSTMICINNEEEQRIQNWLWCASDMSVRALTGQWIENILIWRRRKTAQPCADA